MGRRPAAALKSPSRHLLCLGCGYVATALARRLLARGWQITGTVREAARAGDLQTMGIGVLRGPVTADGLRDSLAACTHLLLSAPPTAEGDPFYGAVRDALLEQREKPLSLAYLSSTGVYGDRQGAWVDETAKLAPAGGQAEARVLAEAAWQMLGLRLGVTVQIFRLAAIYGPGRAPFARLPARARLPETAGQKFSRIHVCDIARALEACLARPVPGAVYNLADDEPATRSDFFAHAARLLGVPAPLFLPPEELDLATSARRRFDEHRQVSNRFLKARLLPHLDYPTYREGLAGIYRYRRQMRQK